MQIHWLEGAASKCAETVCSSVEGLPKIVNKTRQLVVGQHIQAFGQSRQFDSGARIARRVRIALA